MTIYTFPCIAILADYLHAGTPAQNILTCILRHAPRLHWLLSEMVSVGENEQGD
jgi:hypothetical protein